MAAETPIRGWCTEGVIRRYIDGFTADVDSTAAASSEGAIIDEVRIALEKWSRGRAAALRSAARYMNTRSREDDSHGNRTEMWEAAEYPLARG